jgi:hypothetical protein
MAVVELLFDCEAVLLVCLLHPKSLSCVENVKTVDSATPNAFRSTKQLCKTTQHTVVMSFLAWHVSIYQLNPDFEHRGTLEFHSQTRAHMQSLSTGQA